ncbi:FHA domain-containing protein [Pyxidicoccus parkwayensis]|uniref:FHA domain-containing protein n=1 Tax=Pyxidicoccus parkwayensis TaxID=2813578 RepID=A0ABX7P990_9BACT|nr:FHA domain-containing protein [Pyxidicoccus parkwaysis]QSQ27033.1 FHA domain-containing protein [Pyxidicoccus parkwaysis]
MSQLLLSALAVVCPNCDGYNPPRSAACAVCGQSLEEAARSPAGKPAGAPPRPVAPAAGRPVAVSNFPGPKGEAVTTPPPPPSAIPPGLRPSARTPPPTAAAGLQVERPVPVGARVTAPAGGAAAVPPVAARSGGGPAPVPPGPAATRPPPPVPDNTMPSRAGATPAAGPPSGARPVPPAASRFGLAVIAGSTRGQRYKLPVTGCVVGRQRGAILFPDDAYVSPLHATFLVKDGALFVRDESSASGVFVAVAGTEALAPRTLFSAGQRLFRYTGRLEPVAPVAGRPNVYGAPVPLGQAVYGVEEVLVGGRAGRAVVTAAPLLTIGQAHCDLSFPGDEGLAGRHCELSPTPTGALLRDLSGGLGTYVRLAAGVERPLRPGDRVRLGQHVLQVENLG